MLGLTPHESMEEYSSWLLPAVNQLLNQAGVRMAEISGYAVAAGPGSFTGVRVGLTSVKAWAEVYGQPVLAVSRLEAFAAEATDALHYVAAFLNAQRGQVFGAVYRREGAWLTLVGEEMVIAPEKFIETVAELGVGQTVNWVSPDAPLITGEAAWKGRKERGEFVEQVSATVAPTIGRIGVRRLKQGKTTDALGLDANYVRRSDAEIFWKGGAAHGH